MTRVIPYGSHLVLWHRIVAVRRNNRGCNWEGWKDASWLRSQDIYSWIKSIIIPLCCSCRLWTCIMHSGWQDVSQNNTGAMSQVLQYVFSCLHYRNGCTPNTKDLVCIFYCITIQCLVWRDFIISWSRMAIKGNCFMGGEWRYNIVWCCMCLLFIATADSNSQP